MEIELGAGGAGRIPGRDDVTDRSVWRDGWFVAFWAAQLVANLGTFVLIVGAVWLVGDLGGGPVIVALMQTAVTAAAIFVGLPASTLADVFNRRRVLIVTQLWLIAIAASLSLLVARSTVNPIVLYVVVLAQGAGLAVNLPAWLAIQPDLVARSQLPRAIALGSVNGQLARAIGPAVGGVLIALGGPELAFLVSSAAFLGLLVVSSAWTPSVAEPVRRERFGPAMRSGLRYAWYSLAFRRVLLRSGYFFVPASALFALLPVVSRDQLRQDAAEYGVLMAAFGAGAVAAAFSLPVLRRRWSVERIISVAVVSTGVIALTTGFAESASAVVALAAVGGAAWTAAGASLTFSAQRSLPPWVRARGLGLYLVVAQGGVAVGGLVWGVVAAALSVQWALVAAAVACGGAALVSTRWPLDVLEGLDLSPAPNSPTMHPPAITSGPVLVQIRHRFRSVEDPDVGRVMSRIERLRRRTGARSWGAWVDPSAPDFVTELYELDSWEAVASQRDRLTVTDAAVEAALAALVVQPSTLSFLQPPVARRD